VRIEAALPASGVSGSLGSALRVAVPHSLSSVTRMAAEAAGVANVAVLGVLFARLTSSTVETPRKVLRDVLACERYPNVSWL